MNIGRRLLHLAERTPDAPAFEFATRETKIDNRLTFGSLAARSTALAAQLQVLDGRGKRAALIFSPGLDFMVALLGCMLAGVIAVPMALPRRLASRDSADAIIQNCTPHFVLTTKALVTRLSAGLADRPQWQGRTWLVTDADAEYTAIAANFTPTPIDIAILQYTSGSTSAPKGVMVSHANLLSNLSMMRKSFGTSSASTFACWVPLFHDMGLVANALHALFVGGRCILMAPLSFMQRPLAWLKVISDHRVDVAGCPNFGYDHCVDYLRNRPVEGIDLSSWRVAFNGAEPIRSATLDRFATAFAPFGFDRRALFPCYGMAEATVIISGKTDRNGPVLECRVGNRSLVSCGSALDGEEVAVVHPDTCSRQAAGIEGEIWVRGPHIAAGYWENAEATATNFNACVEGEDGGWLRTGDLGFLDARGELFVTGRLKDLIVVRGQNYYPQDIELSVQEGHAAFGQQLGAAFVAPAGRNESAVVVVQEADHRLLRLASPGELEAAVREAVALDHGLAVHKAVIVAPGAVPRTTSGKVQRAKARALWLAGFFG
ncbi:acyl-CoA synthetase [Reyranella soli]|uniref:Acyl-CoA synthetase n=1 Tax=Reyranella soli TaxID=1230389 RepID=A0A512N7A4_9HYPH|nr:acyl-CoA synthetase [Reyranella soli]